MAPGLSDGTRPAPNLLRRQFAQIAGGVAGFTGHPLTFIFSCLAVAAWAIASLIFHFVDRWQTLIGTSITMGTFLMVFLIQHTQNRNSAAVQAKLDELIRALEPANNKFIGLEHQTIEHVHELRLETVAEEASKELVTDIKRESGQSEDEHAAI
jgi:low affinity Fe/Cu permease